VFFFFPLVALSIENLRDPGGQLPADAEPEAPGEIERTGVDVLFSSNFDHVPTSRRPSHEMYACR